MTCSSIVRALSVVRQGLTLGVEFGTHSLEALLWVAETVEESVYRPGSLRVEAGALRFELDNPPLRAGAFSAVRLRWNGAEVDPVAVRLRTRADLTWRVAHDIGSDHPLLLRPGVPIEVAASVAPAPVGTAGTVRLELESAAIPPLVWLEFHDAVREG